MIGAAVLLYACNKLWFSPRRLRPAPPLPGLVFQRPSGRGPAAGPGGASSRSGAAVPHTLRSGRRRYLLACGLFLELAPLLYKPSSVCDPWDLLAYLAGGLLALPPGAAAAQP
ncbi:hypothetical protein M5E87_25265 [Flavonifractor plautii]|nr:hypothetical protein M5E87_25265 [Flavonifractor plautii]